MAYNDGEKFDGELYENLRADCKKCFGLCCVALYFSASEGFPNDKSAGEPCLNLQSDFSCSIHKNLRNKGLKGCSAYDCFGAGQKVAQVTYGGNDWSQVSESANEMFDVFLVMRQLHEMLWYLTGALTLQTTPSMKEKLREIIRETERITHMDVNYLISFDIDTHRNDVNTLLAQTSEAVRSRVSSIKNTSLKGYKKISRGLDFIGRDLRKTNLIGANLRGAFLIAADLRGANLRGVDFIGADLRDTDLRGADLTGSIFLTQAQINTAKGDSNTKLPMELVRPAYWEK